VSLSRGRQFYAAVTAQLHGGGDITCRSYEPAPSSISDLGVAPRA
jgi:hypothetical protein